MEKNKLLFVLGIIGILLISFASASIFSNVWGKITGNATSGTTTLSITIGNVIPTIPIVNAISAQNPTAAGSTAVSVNFTVVDTDGAANINGNSGTANFSMAGQTARSNTTACTNWSSSGNTMNFTCTVNMQYWDKNGAWTINVTADNINNGLGLNSSTTFTYNLLTSMTMSPTSLSWPTIYIANTNTGSTNNPLTVNNTGNDAPISITTTTLDLRGATTTSQYIYANNFTVDNTTAGCSGTAMVNSTATNVTNALLYAGNNTLSYGNATSGQEQIYFCLKGVLPTLTAQSYTSTSLGPWTVAITH